VLSAQKLKPISWREWAGEIERDGGARNPYLSLEERYGFWDIRVSFGSTRCLAGATSAVWVYCGCASIARCHRWFGLKLTFEQHRLSGGSLRTGFAVRMCRSRSDG
jgi:hypothetical protein